MAYLGDLLILIGLILLGMSVHVIFGLPALVGYLGGLCIVFGLVIELRPRSGGGR